MTILTRVLAWLFDPFDLQDVEYYDHFVRPKVERAQALGIPDADIDAMWLEALQDANPLIVGGAPGSRFAALIDAWEREHTEGSEVSK